MSLPVWHFAPGLLAAIEEVSEQEEGGGLPEFPIVHTLVLIVPLEDDKLYMLGLSGQRLLEHVDVGESTPDQDAEHVHPGFAIHHPEGLDHVEDLGRIPVGRSVEDGQVAAGEGGDLLVDLLQVDQARVAGEEEDFAGFFDAVRVRVVLA